MIDKEKASVYLKNSQGVELKGYFFPNNSSTCVLCIPGFGGAFGASFVNLCEKCLENGYDFLFCHTQGSYTQKQLKKYNNDGSFEYVMRGGCYEDFDNVIPDIDAWINFIKDKNYNNIYLVGASLGCDKIVKYISEKTIKNLKKIVFMCPQDIAARFDKDMLEEARQNLKNNEPYKILSKLFLDFCPISSKTQYDLVCREDIHNFMYLHDNPSFPNLNKINVPVLCIIGTKDQGLTCGNKTPQFYMELLRKNIKNCTIEFVDGAKHNFSGYENELNTKILDFLKLRF